jgi:DNA repair exonuclease SbcCD ATPase subunit
VCSSDLLAREHWVEIQSYKTQFESLKQSIEQIRVVNEQLKKKLFQRNEQFLELQDRLAEKIAQLNVAEKGLEQIKAGAMDKGSVEQLKAEVSVLKEQLAKREDELSRRDEREEQLRDELQEVKKHSPAAAEAGILSRLKQLDVVFVAYHPGAGHVTIPFSDIKRYSDNPRAFVAAKCFVTEEQYTEWLNHYENPVCRHYSEKGELCGQTLKAVAVPSEFEPGVSDRCKLHDGRMF